MSELKWYRVFDTPQEAMERIPPGRLQLVRIGERRICVAHTAHGFHAVSDTCPHMGESLSGGTVNHLNEIICPLHEYRFSLEFGVECSHRTPPLGIYQIELREDGLFLGVWVDRKR